MNTPSPARSWTTAGLVGLPVYGAILALTTRKPQPDQVTDPDGWARFVSSSSYLVEHVVSNVLGATLVILGTLALGALLSSSRSPRLGLTGAVLAAAGQILFMVPGTISTFATPAIGAAYVQGNQSVMGVEFTPVLGLITGVGLLLVVSGNILLGWAVWRSGVLQRWAGVLWITGTLTFYVFGALLGMVTINASLATQPGGAVLLTISSAWIAWSVLRARRPDGQETPDESVPRRAPQVEQRAR